MKKKGSERFLGIRIALSPDQSDAFQPATTQYQYFFNSRNLRNLRPINCFILLAPTVFDPVNSGAPPSGRFPGCIRCLTCYGIPGVLFCFWQSRSPSIACTRNGRPWVDCGSPALVRGQIKTGSVAKTGKGWIWPQITQITQIKKDYLILGGYWLKCLVCGTAQ